MPPTPVDAIHSLISAFGASFAPGDAAPPYEASLDGSKIRLTTSRGVIEEHASEWKRLCGRLWAQVLPEERARALEILLPTLSDFDGAVWPPMQRLLEDDAVASALRTLEASLPDPLEALTCARSAFFAESIHAEHPFRSGAISAAQHAAFAKKSSLSTMELVKIPLEFLSSPIPLERLEALYWLREAMRENPTKVLGIQRLLVQHVLPICREGVGLFREGALSVIERWAPRMVSRAAYPEALPMLDTLLSYGVAIPRLLPLRYEALLGSNEPAEAERTLSRLRAVADASGHLRSPWLRADSHVDDLCAIASWQVAKVFRQVADGAHPFAERRLKNEPAPPAVTASEAAEISRSLAARALELFQRRAAEPPAVAYPPATMSTSRGPRAYPSRPDRAGQGDASPPRREGGSVLLVRREPEQRRWAKRICRPATWRSTGIGSQQLAD
ncbi:Hypothetical protein A7982_07066 [Minicystis rosea]|nr:Hypothetical protein A7982_07066 [Minicystis rosea]